MTTLEDIDGYGLYLENNNKKMKMFFVLVRAAAAYWCLLLAPLAAAGVSAISDNVSPKLDIDWLPPNLPLPIQILR